MGELTSKHCLILVALVFSQTAFCRECGTRGSNTRKKRLTSNEDSKARITEWPWMVGIVNKTSKEIHCSGSLISDRFVLTAAHCVDGIANEDLQLVFGTDDLSNTWWSDYGEEREIKQSFKHPKHDKEKGTHYYDIGIFEISGEDLAVSDGITPICLPKKAVYNVDSRKGDGVTLTGFGKKSKEGSANIEDVPLRLAQLEIYAQQRCNESYANVTESLPDLFQSNILCASYQIAGEGSCKGDSGGPLVSYVSDDRYYEQVAVVSGKKGQCGNKNYPDIYVRLEDYEVLKWIYKEAFGSRPGRDPTDLELSILKDSAKSGNLAAIVRIVEELTDINPVVLKDGASLSHLTILHLAASYGKLEVVKYFTNLLEDKNPGQKSVGSYYDGNTPMHYAAQEGHSDVVQHFAEILEDKNPSNNIGYTPLHYAAKYGHIKVVEMLVLLLEDKNPKPGVVEWAKETPLDIAALNGHLDIVEYLATFVDDEESIRTAINYAKESNHSNVVKFLRDTHPSLVLTPTDEELSDLAYSAQIGNLAKIVQITQALTDINPVALDGWTHWTNHSHWTILHNAAYYGQLEIVQYYTDRLEDKNPGKKSGDKFDGRTPMHLAAENGLDSYVIKHFTEILEDKNPSDINGYTPLHLAAENGHIEIVELLVPLLEDKNPKSGEVWDRRTPLDTAAWKGHLDIVEYLAPYVNDEESIRTAIKYAKKYGYSNVVKFLRETNPSLVLTLTPTDEDLSELLTAAKTGYLAKIIQITQALTDINPILKNTDWTVLHTAAYYGQLNIVKYYTDQLEDKNPGKKSGDEYDGRTPMHYAARKGHTNVVEYFVQLIEDKNPSDINGYTPLHSAAKFGQIKVVEMLVPLLGDKNPKSGVFWDKRTPLDIAAWYGHLDIVQYLQPFVDDEDSIKSAINYAKASNHGDIVKFLRETHPSLVLTPTDSELSELEDAAQTGNLTKIIQITHALTDINPIVGDIDWTVLHYAAFFGQLNIVKYYTGQLEDKNPGEKSEGKFNGRTPMHAATQEGHLNVVKHFVEILEDKNPSDTNGYTPLHLAAEFGHIEVVELLVPLLEDKNPKSGVFWNEETPFNAAAWYGHLDIVQYLQPFADDEDSIKTAIKYAKENGFNDIVTFLISKKKTPADFDLSELEDAVKSGDLSKIISITNKFTDINPVIDNIRYWTVLHKAAFYGHLNIVKYYTDQLINPRNEFGTTPLHIAAQKGQLDVMKHLVPLLENKNPKAGVFMDEGTPLEYAASAGHLNVVQYLTPFVEDDEEVIHSAIESAEKKGHTDIVDYLKELNVSLGRTSTYPEDEFTTINPFEDYDEERNVE